MVNYIYLGYGTTNSNGVAKLDHDANGDALTDSYTGVGAGEVDIVASMDSPSDISVSSLQSDPYQVIDAKVICSNTGYCASATESLNDGIITVGPTVSTYGLYYISSDATSNGRYSNPVGTVYEFDLIHSSSCSFRLDGVNDGGNLGIEFTNDFVDGSHVKIKHNASTIVVEINGVEVTSKPCSSDNRRLGFRINGGGSLSFRNLLFY